MTELAVITGASSGIGAELARGLARRKYDCVLVARREDRLRELAAELEKDHGVKAAVIALDLGAPGSAAELHAQVSALGQPVGFLVNNAGFGIHGDFVDHDADRLAMMMQLNMVTLTELTHAFAKDMVAAGRGRILQVASVGAFQPSPYYASYSATKAYVRDFSQALHFELRGTGVTCTTICPGLTATEFHEVADHPKPAYMNAVMMKARDVAEIGLRAAERGRAGVTPGIFNKLMELSVKFWTPRWLATWMAGVSMRPEKKGAAPSSAAKPAAAADEARP